jgi:aspartyl-tRNA(Asn)/glutamyl-tRNA(Gln) amidotransferase subunit C
MSEERMAVSVEDVRHVAGLANLELTADELPRMAKDLNAVLGYIVQMNELDTSSVEPMAQVGQALGLKAAVGGETLRADVVRPSVDRGAVMAAAPETDGRFFKVPKVIER